jgi:hypothetical protein
MLPVKQWFSFAHAPLVRSHVRPETNGPRSTTGTVSVTPLYRNVTSVPHFGVDAPPDERLGHLLTAGGAVPYRPGPYHEMLLSWRHTFAGRCGRRGGLGRANRSREGLGSQVWLDKGRTRIQVSGGPGPWILGLDRHRRPARKRCDLDTFEEAGVGAGKRAGDPRTDRTRDGDRGEDGDERHARDTSGVARSEGTVPRDLASAGFRHYS